jgi:hypothetical protein
VPAGPGAEPEVNTLPELDRRLLVQRTAMVDTVERLRRRMRHDIRQLSPVEQAQRHPEAALGAVAIAGLITGRIVGGIAALILKR